MQRRPAFPLSSRTGSLPCQEPQNQQPEWTLFHPPFQKYALYGRRIAQMFDHSITESQCIAKFLFSHLASGRRIQRLLQPTTTSITVPTTLSQLSAFCPPPASPPP